MPQSYAGSCRHGLDDVADTCCHNFRDIRDRRVAPFGHLRRSEARRGTCRHGPHRRFHGILQPAHHLGGTQYGVPCGCRILDLPKALWPCAFDHPGGDLPQLLGNHHRQCRRNTTRLLIQLCDGPLSPPLHSLPRGRDLGLFAMDVPHPALRDVELAL